MASFTHDTSSSSHHSLDRERPSRPGFSSSKTSDRLRECERRPSIPRTTIKPLRRSVFKEVGLDDVNRTTHHLRDEKEPSVHAIETEGSKGDNTTFEGILKDVEQRREQGTSYTSGSTPWFPKFGKGSRPQIKTAATAPPGSFSTFPRIALIAFLIAVVVPGFRYGGGKEKVIIGGADAGPIMTAELVENGSAIEGRANSPTSICTRWSHQTANINGTLYIYGGQASTESGQTQNRWNNNFLTLDLTKTWQIASPVLSPLPQPSGPPAVANGYLWHSYDKLWLYGGEFSDSPPASPLPVSTWEYDIKSATWNQYWSPQTSNGNNSDGGGQPVQRAAEGAGLSVPELGLSWYFGGHLDLFTTEGWSNQIAREYLKSLLEFTHPGYVNSGVYSLGTTTGAPVGGTYRNITQGGLQADSGFTERADGVLVYVPGWGHDGILLGLAGGTNETMTEMNIIDVYDIASSTWYKQGTSGPSPPIRVDPCAVVAAAPDGSSFNVYLYGGQNLIPYGSQIQYSDMWILTIPSFTWIQVDMTGQSQPPARAGHTCNIWDGQIVVVGGYVGKDISCDSPGIYVFNASSLKWSNTFTALSGSASSSGGGSSGSGSSGSGSSGSGGASGQGGSVLQGSYGYQVPGAVQSVIGGSSSGAATVSTPAAGAASSGPFATGRPPTFTVTQSGSTIIQTTTPTATAVSPPKESKPATSSSTKPGPNVGAIVAGVIAALLAILACYLAFCSWLYRRQLTLYKNHVAMAQRTAFSPEGRNQWSRSEGSGSVAGSGGRFNEKHGSGPVTGGAMLGPFGTEIPAEEGGSLSVPLGTGAGPTPSPGSGDTVVADYGGGTMPGPGKGYGRLSDHEFESAYMSAAAGMPRRSGSTANSSVEDLLGNQEPSFFSVVLNPRRTLRVVNFD